MIDADAPRHLFRFKVFQPRGPALYGRGLHYPAHKADVVIVEDYNWCVCGKRRRSTAVLPDDRLICEGLGRISLAVETLRMLGPCPCGTPEWIR